MRMFKLSLAVLAASIGSGSVPALAGVTILNPSFESPSLGSGNFREGNPPANWTYLGPGGSSGGGIVANGSAYGNSNAPDGNQALLLKSIGGVQQQLSGFVVGDTYTLSLYAEGRTNYNGADPFQVEISAIPLTFSGSTTITPPTTPSTNVYLLYTSDPFTVSTTTPYINILGTSLADNSTFVDFITAQGTPEPTSIAIWGLAIGLGLVVVRRRKA